MKGVMAGVLLLLLSTEAEGQTNFMPAEEQFTVGWTVGTNAVGYEVQTARELIGPWTILSTQAQNQIAQSLQDEQKRYYRVRGTKEADGETIYGPFSDISEKFIGVIFPSKPGKPNLLVLP